MNRPIKWLAELLLVSLLALGASAQESSDAAFTVHVVQRGENLFRVALLYDLFAEQVAEANGITDSSTLFVGQRLIIPLVTSESDRRLTHRVAEGDTLASVAALYSRSVDELLALNNLETAESMVVGQELVIVTGSPEAEASPTATVPAEASPGANTDTAPTTLPGSPIQHSFARFGDPGDTFTHTVQAGDTLSAIGLRYNQTVEALAAENNIVDPSLLHIGQRLTIPGIELPSLLTDLPVFVQAFTVDPLVFQEGRTGRIELVTSEAVTVSGQFLGQELRVIVREDGRRHNILVGLPMFTEMQVYPLTLMVRDASGATSSIRANLQMILGGYGRQTITIDNSELLAPAVEDNEIALLTRLSSAYNEERSWSNSLSLPAAAAMNALFGTLRSYNGSPFDRFHRGVDFAGAPGTPVLAAADGTVVMSDRLHIRGNATMIDHGWGVYTVYAHQTEAMVQPGDSVASGQVIGSVGSTGRSTGPHLHWEVWLNGVNVDPLQWVQETFP